MTLPGGTVTFLFTDIEGSTKLWEEYPEAMNSALAQHDSLLRQAIETNKGFVFKTIGDAFASPPDALQASLSAQLCLEEMNARGGTEPKLNVRMALHSGRANQREGDYFNQPLNRVARLLAIGHGGQILLSELANIDLVNQLPAGVTLQDMGVHRLKDLHQPEQVFQVLHSGLPANFPPLASLNLLQHNLPIQTTSFIGRHKEIVSIKALLVKSRLLTLTGSGGTGKTRLMLQVAADTVEGDGVWLVEFAPLSDPDLVAQTVASALSVREDANRTVLQNLIETLKPKKMLLLLDNCEHILDAVAALCDALLKSCPNLKILASSREGLGVQGEQTFRIPSLELPPPSAASERFPAQIAEKYESVRMFVERTMLAKPDFKLTDFNVTAVARVCQRLDGIPLAIELAAARVVALPVEQIETRLRDRFRLLTGGDRTALRRQQTLRALIDWSYDLLNEAEKALLLRLSVFTGDGISKQPSKSAPMKESKNGMFSNC